MSARLLTKCCLFVCILLCKVHAGDEQWDDRLGSAPTYDYGELVLYRNEVYGSGYKWTGTNLVPWILTTSGFVKAVDGTNLFVGGAGANMLGLPKGVARWDGATWNPLDGGIPEAGDFGYHV